MTIPVYSVHPAFIARKFLVGAVAGQITVTATAANSENNNNINDNVINNKF